MDLNEVLTLDSTDALDHIIEAVNELLGIRREVQSQSWFESYTKKDGYEKAL
jgi:hypothetical protein